MRFSSQCPSDPSSQEGVGLLADSLPQSTVSSLSKNLSTVNCQLSVILFVTKKKNWTKQVQDALQMQHLHCESSKLHASEGALQKAAM